MTVHYSLVDTFIQSDILYSWLDKAGYNLRWSNFRLKAQRLIAATHVAKPGLEPPIFSIPVMHHSNYAAGCPKTPHTPLAKRTIGYTREEREIKRCMTCNLGSQTIGSKPGTVSEFPVKLIEDRELSIRFLTQIMNLQRFWICLWVRLPSVQLRAVHRVNMNSDRVHLPLTLLAEYLHWPIYIVPADRWLYIYQSLLLPEQRVSLQECPSGVVNEETFKQIYSQFFPHGGKLTFIKCVCVCVCACTCVHLCICACKGFLCCMHVFASTICVSVSVFWTDSNVGFA